MVEICSNHATRILFAGPTCPLCAAEKRIQAQDEELGRKDHEITQLEGTIADLREKLTPEPQ